MTSPSQKCTASEHWQPGVSSSPTSVFRNGGKLALKPMMGHRRKYVSKSFIRRKSVMFGCPEHKGVSSRHVSERRKKLGRVVQTETEECIDQTAGTRSADNLRFLAEAEMRALENDDMDDSDVDDFEAVPGRNAAVLTWPRVHLEDNPMSPSAKRACKIPPPMCRIPTQPDIEMGTVPLPVPEDAMEVDFDAGVEPASVRRGAKRASALWEKRADRTDMEVCPDTTGECCNRDAVETLSWCATVGGNRTEQECEMFRRRHEYEKSSMQTVISTTTSHKAKRDETQPRVVILVYADAMRVPEHYARTLSTRTLQPVISRVMSKCRTRQLESCDTLSAFFRAWLSRGVRMKPPKDPGLSDGWRWQLARALFPLSPGVSTQWLQGGVHRATDARCVESLAGLSVVKGLKSSS